MENKINQDHLIESFDLESAEDRVIVHYGASGDQVRKDSGLTIEEAEQLQKDLWEKFPDLKKFVEDKSTDCTESSEGSDHIDKH